MPTQVDIPPLFQKYPAVLKQFENLLNQLKADERPGDKIPHAGFDVYKLRLPNPSAKRGKSGGFRVIYYVQVVDRVALLRIYSKTEQIDISPEEIRRIVEELLPPADDESDDM
jgi:mRNA-degrading endonuclease RelE of RelBE toxin-antitoxin system